MTLDEWVAATKRDAERRGLPQLASLIEGLRPSLERLRAADWNDDMRGGAGAGCEPTPHGLERLNACAVSHASRSRHADTGRRCARPPPRRLLVARSHRRRAGAHRGRRRPDQRVHRGHRRPRTGAGGARGRRARARSRSWRPARPPYLAQGSVRSRRVADDGGVAGAGGPHRRGRCAGRGAAARCRGGVRRQDQPPRVRARNDQRRLGVRSRASSARSVTIARRIERRIGRIGDCRHVPRDVGVGHRRVHPHSRRRLRTGRSQAGVRRALVPRRRGAQPIARSRRTARAYR